jgi:hypothetical protein
MLMASLRLGACCSAGTATAMATGDGDRLCRALAQHAA